MRPTQIVCFISATLFFLVMFMPTQGYAGGFRVSFGGHHRNSGHFGHRHSGYGHRSYGYRGSNRYLGYGHRSSYRRYGYGNHYGYGYPYGRYNYSNRLNYGGSFYSPYRSYSGNNSSAYTQSSNFDGTTSPAWVMLGAGQKQSALNAFANEARSNPDSGVPKAGYAIAHASLGDLDKGVWAMRRAFRISPESLHYIDLDNQNSLVVEDLINVYRDNINRNNLNLDAAFMVASLSYIHHDYHAANEYVNIATAEGDASVSVNNLKRLIDEQL